VTIFLTEYYVDGQKYGDEVDAHDWDEAQVMCSNRRPGEKVIGTLEGRVTVDEETAALIALCAKGTVKA